MVDLGESDKTIKVEKVNKYVSMSLVVIFYS